MSQFAKLTHVNGGHASLAQLSIQIDQFIFWENNLVPTFLVHARAVTIFLLWRRLTRFFWNRVSRLYFENFLVDESLFTHVYKKLRVIVLNIFEFVTEHHGLSLERLEFWGVEIIFLGLLHCEHLQDFLLHSAHMHESGALTWIWGLVFDWAVLGLLFITEIKVLVVITRALLIKLFSNL